MELQSVPTEIDVLQRRLLQLQLAERMLGHEEEEHALERLAEVEDEIRQVEKELQDLRRQWEMEKSGLGDIQKVRERLDARQDRVQPRMGRDPPRCSSAASAPTRRSSRRWPRSTPSERTWKSEIAEAEALGRRPAQGGQPAPQEGGRFRGDRRGRQPVDRHSRSRGCSRPSARSCSSWKIRSISGWSTRTPPCTPSPTPSAAAGPGLQDPNRPIGSFLFLGPTGVGKTELAKALAEFLFDSETAMVRLDMSEFGERHNVARLIGAPPGYVGYEEGGRLTEAIRRRPYSVVLLDEIEKAHRDVFNVLLQVLDDGRLTDGQGRTVDFRNTVIIMTSNLGSQIIAELAGTGDETRMRREVQNVLKTEFLPEFLNRIDETIIFHPLGMKELTRIVDIQLRRLEGQLAEAGLTLRVTDEAKDRLAEEGFDPAYGARPLKRIIQQRLANPLATALLEQKIAEGDTVEIGWDPSRHDFALTPTRTVAAKA